MEKDKPPSSERSTWRVGQLVQRKETSELGKVVETDGYIKVKWDGGRTSYFLHGQSANVRSRPLEEEPPHPGGR